VRIGQNPSKIKGIAAYKPTRVGIASLTYIPALEGYFRESLEVIRVHLLSLHASLNQECDLLVFDNGSCPEVISFLEEQWESGMIDWLALSHHNLGKNGALNWIFSAMPNEYIAYSDSDVFYRPGWLEESLHIYEAFDRAGMVSAQPVFFDFLRGHGTTAKQINEFGDYLKVISEKPPIDVVSEYCEGINAPEEMRKQFEEQELQVAVNEVNGSRGITTATDMQFMLSKEVARKLIPLPIAGALTAKDAIDIPLGIEKLGYWLLSTEKPLVWHMGNSLQVSNYKEVDELKVNSVPYHRSISTTVHNKGVKNRMRLSLGNLIRRSPRSKRFVERIYGGLFSLLYDDYNSPQSQ